jgi:hypothetical protein
VCVVLDELAFFVVFNPFKKFSSLPVSFEDKNVFKCYFFVLITFFVGGGGGRGEFTFWNECYTVQRRLKFVLFA